MFIARGDLGLILTLSGLGPKHPPGAGMVGGGLIRDEGDQSVGRSSVGFPSALDLDSSDFPIVSGEDFLDDSQRPISDLECLVLDVD